MDSFCVSCGLCPCNNTHAVIGEIFVGTALVTGSTLSWPSQHKLHTVTHPPPKLQPHAIEPLAQALNHKIHKQQKVIH